MREEAITEGQLREVLVRLNSHFGVSFTMSMNRGVRGWAYSDRGSFSIPPHALRQGIQYGQYYVCHEFAHLLVSAKHGHDETFRLKERELCAMYGLTVELKKAYPRALMQAGQVVYGEPAHPDESPAAHDRRMRRNESSRRCKAKERRQR